MGDYTSNGKDNAVTGDAGAQPAEGTELVISLLAIAGIRTKDTMMVPVRPSSTEA